MDKELYPIPEVIEKCSTSKTAVYGQIKDGKLKVTKIGRRTYVAHEDLQSWIAGLRSASQAA